METVLKVGLVVLVAVPLAISGAWLWNLLAQRRRAASIRSRAPMPPEVFFDTYYQSSGLPREVVLKLLQDLERATGVPRILLRPEDRLWEGSVVDESVFDSLQTVELTMMLEELEEETGERLAVESIDTVDRYIRIVGLLERQRVMKQRPVAR